MAPALKLLDILQVLGRHKVDFILVGGVAAVLEGAPVATFDLDVVPDPAPENRARLLEALRELNARYLDPAGRHFVPDEAKLASLRLHQLLTDAGPLDVQATQPCLPQRERRLLLRCERRGLRCLSLPQRCKCRLFRCRRLP